MSEAHSKRKGQASHADDESAATPVKAPKKRTKSGCLTCRRRRIKCDEGKPDCKNCIKAKKTCEQAPVQQNATRRVSSKHEPEVPRESQAGSTNILSNLDRVKTESTDTTVSSLHYSQSYTSSVSYGSRQSPKEILDSTYSPYAAPTENAPLSELFKAYSAESQGGRDSLDDIRSYSEPYVPELTTPALAFSNLGLISPVYQAAEDDAQFPFFSTSLPNSLSSKESQMMHIPNCSQRSTSVGINSKTFRTRASIDPSILSRQEFAAKMGLDFRIDKETYGNVLSKRQKNYLRHFILDVNMNFTTTTEAPSPHTGDMIITTSNLFTQIIPSMALRSAALLHALLAIAALHEANIAHKPEHEALMDYQEAIRHLAQSLPESSAFECDSLLATCLILAYFETMSGHVVKWGRHLQGSCDIVRARIMAQYTANQPGHYQFVAEPTVADHLIWFHIHQDTIQCVLSGNGLFLDLRYIQMCPIRGNPGSVLHVSDQLRVLVARVGDFVAKDRLRKEKNNHNKQALAVAVIDWDELIAAMHDWRSNLKPNYESSVLPNSTSPFGPVLVFAHPAIASFQILSLATLLYLHRSHPHFSPLPAESMRAAASTTHLIIQDIFKIMGGIMAKSSRDKSIESGAHLKAMINAMLPALLAGIAIRETSQRAYIERIVQDIYTYTGWRTAIRVLQGLDVAWGREPRPAEGLDLLNEPHYKHEFTKEPETAQYANLDRAETMSVATGILGKLKLKDPTSPVMSSDEHGMHEYGRDHESVNGGGGGGADLGMGYMDGHAPFVDWHMPIEAFMEGL